ncbi:MAG: cupin [Nevskia sp.]|nr:cupin [Nevskia sp.]
MSALSNTGDEWIARLDLQPHPEGGWFRRIYTADQQLPCEQGVRPLATSIYYLLNAQQPRGCLHRNRSDILHFLIDGGPLEYWVLNAAGALQRTRLGADGEHFLLVPGACWKASQLVDGATQGLIAEVVTPGFDYADHQFADAAEIQRQYPQHFDALRPFLRGAGD